MRYDTREDLARAFNRVYVTHLGEVRYALVDGLSIRLSDERGNTQYILAGHKEFYLGMPNLGFAPELKNADMLEAQALLHISRNPSRQYSFGISNRTMNVKTFRVKEGHKALATRQTVMESLGNQLWPTLRGVYKEAKVVLAAGGGLSKAYGITCTGDVIFSNSNIGKVLDQKDGIALYGTHFYNSIIRDDLDKIGVKRVVQYEENGKEED